jgi:hypothetical protein
MPFLSNRGIKCKGVVMNSKKVLKLDFKLFYKTCESKVIQSKKIFQKKYFFSIATSLSRSLRIKILSLPKFYK